MATALALIMLLKGDVWASAPKSVAPALIIQAATSAAAMPDRRFIFGRSHGQVFVWHALTGNLIAAAQGEGGAVDPRTGIAILGAEIWDLEEGTLLMASGLTEREVVASGISRDGRFAAIVGSDIRIWDLPGKKLFGNVKNPIRRPSFLALSDGAGFIAVGRGAQFDVIEVRAGRRAKSGSLAAVWPFRTSPSKGFSEFVDDRAMDFTVIYERAGSARGTRQRPLWRIDWEVGKVNIFADFLPSAGLTARPRGQDVDIMWAVEGSSQTTLSGHAAPVRRVAFSPDGWTVATGDSSGEVRLWDAHSGELRSLCQGGTDEIVSLGFSPDAQFLMAANSSEIRIYAISP